MLVEISSADLTAIVDDVLGAMAGIQLAPCQQPAVPDSQCCKVASAVQIVGDWQGAVRLDIDLDLARLACANLTGVGAAELSSQDVRDAAGELANMVGGSVKAICASTSRLSLPTVTMGRDFEFSLCQGSVIQALSFSHPTGYLTVSVIEKQKHAAACKLPEELHTGVMQNKIADR
jgi:chemotaxis protein CheX